MSEGSAQNLFLVEKGVLVTPPTTSAILPGITRDAVITMARDLGYEVREQRVTWAGRRVARYLDSAIK